MSKNKVAIIGSGNIGTDLMFKVIRLSTQLEMGVLVGIDPESDGLRRAQRLGIPTTAAGVEGLLAMPEFDDIAIVFDATSAGAHRVNNALLAPTERRVVDLTPAAIGPYVVPPVNLGEHLDSPNVNMVTCGGQATIPMVAAVSRVTPALYAEIVASISSKSAGPGTRANIDEFTETTSRAIEVVGGAAKAKAIIVLNPAEPPLIMRDTVHCLVGDADHDAIERSVADMVEVVSSYVPGYRLKQRVQFRTLTADSPAQDLIGDTKSFARQQVSIYLEVEGAAHYLPSYAGNLDIMTSAALQVGERLSLPTKELLS
jgi:acetaldehyde dehydrogenase